MKKILSVFLSIVIIFSSITALPLTSFANEENISIGFVENPVYAKNKSAVSRRKSRSVVSTDILKSAVSVRDAMVLRDEIIYIKFTSLTDLSVDEMKEQIYQLIMKATSDELSVSAVDGDYIRWQWYGYQASYNRSQNSTGSYYYNLKLNITYNDSAKDEQEIDAVIEKFFSQINLSSYSDYELLKKFHDFILNSCEYDYDYATKNDRYNFSIYGALVRGKTVCQGYALAFYRLCKEAGIDVRFVSSDPDVGCHAWNLVYIGDAYYYVDCTWDDQLNDKYTLFLVDYDTIQSLDTNFEHKLQEEYYSDIYFENNYGQYISNNNWNLQSKNLGNCAVTLDYGHNIVSKITDRNGAVLVSGRDYVLKPGDGGYAAVINGLGEYAGSFAKRKNFIYGLNPVLSYTSTYYTNEPKTPKVTVGNLILNKDYTVSYSNNLNSGTACVTVRGLGKYCGFTDAEFVILKSNINSFPVELSFNSVYYDATAKKPLVTVGNLRQGKDYTVSYSSNVNPGRAVVTVKGTGNCYGEVKKNFNILSRTVKNRKITLSKTSYTYNGYAKKPGVSVYGLTEGVDYKVSYSSNVYPGYGKVTVTGIGKYSDTASAYFRIYPQQMAPLKASSKDTCVTLSWKRVKGVSGYYIQYYSYSEKKWKKATEVSSSKYSTVIKNLTPCKGYKFRIRAFKTVNGKRFYGEASESIRIYTRPKKVSLKSLSTSKKSITVKWKKTTSTGYQIEYSTSSKFSKSKKITVSGSSKTSRKISSLKKGKKYYVRVRAYKTVSGKRYYGSWSSKKSVTCK